MHTSLMHTSVHISPSVGSRCLWFHFCFPSSSSFSEWRLMQSAAFQKTQVLGFSGSPKPRVFVENGSVHPTPPPSAPPPSYTSVSYLHLGSKFSTENGGWGWRARNKYSICFSFTQIKTLFLIFVSVFCFVLFFRLQRLTLISEKHSCNKWAWLLKCDMYRETFVLTMQLRWHLDISDKLLHSGHRTATVRFRIFPLEF